MTNWNSYNTTLTYATSGKSYATLNNRCDACNSPLKLNSDPHVLFTCEKYVNNNTAVCISCIHNETIIPYTWIKAMHSSNITRSFIPTPRLQLMQCKCCNKPMLSITSINVDSLSYGYTARRKLNSILRVYHTIPQMADLVDIVQNAITNKQKLKYNNVHNYPHYAVINVIASIMSPMVMMKYEKYMANGTLILDTDYDYRIMVDHRLKTEMSNAEIFIKPVELVNYTAVVRSKYLTLQTFAANGNWYRVYSMLFRKKIVNKILDPDLMQVYMM